LSSVDDPNSELPQHIKELNWKIMQMEYAAASSQKLNFLEIATNHKSEQVLGTNVLESCRQNQATSFCGDVHPTLLRSKNEYCRVNGNFYDSMYQRWLGPWSTDGTDEFQLVVVAKSAANGMETLSEFLPNSMVHGIFSSCPQRDPFENEQFSYDDYEGYQQRRIHCLDVRDYQQLKGVWESEMKPMYGYPLKVVVNEGAHRSSWQMAMALFFWFPRLEPQGLFFLEGIQETTTFRKEFLPQLIRDIHWCGSPPLDLIEGSEEEANEEQPCFPTIHRLLKSFHCELHICVFERNNVVVSMEYDLAESTPPPNALNASLCPVYSTH